ncbi:T-complex protein 11-domain-containing protein [Spinellus fusiger]|nr:T-complex protein 11-domain-containing protein [Spinellus fusiger]
MQKNNLLQLSTGNLSESSELLRECSSYGQPSPLDSISISPLLVDSVHTEMDRVSTTSSVSIENLRCTTNHLDFHSFYMGSNKNRYPSTRHYLKCKHLSSSVRPCAFIRRRVRSSPRFIGVRRNLMRRRWVNRRRRYAHLSVNESGRFAFIADQMNMSMSAESPQPNSIRRETRGHSTQTDAGSFVSATQVSNTSGYLPRVNYDASYANGNYLSTTTKDTSVKNNWTPPISVSSLEELSMESIFNNLQLRHDMMFDPTLSFRPNMDGMSGRDKRRKVENYWLRVSQAMQLVLNPPPEILRNGTIPLEYYDFLSTLLDELVKILLSFSETPFSNKEGPCPSWEWPDHISKKNITEVLDPKIVIQQMRFTTEGFSNKIDYLIKLFEALCSPNFSTRLQTVTRLFHQEQYVNAFRQCFSLLELVKLDCANKVIRHYRTFLIGSCPEFEWRCFMKEANNGQLGIDSVYLWYKMNWERQGHSEEFLDIYYEDDQETIMALGTRPVPFPATLQFDEKRLTHLFRYEFQNIIVTSILLIPYRHLAGKHQSVDDIMKLKRLFAFFLEGAFILTTPETEHSSEDVAQGLKEGTIISCYNLALHACNVAILAHERSNSSGTGTKDEKPPALDNSQLTLQATFWGDWLCHNLRPGSPIYMLMYNRICKFLKSCASSNVEEQEQKGKHRDPEVDTGILCLEEELRSLGQNIGMIAKTNLDTYTSVYSFVAKLVKQDIFGHKKTDTIIN